MFNNNADLFVTYEKVTRERPGVNCAVKFADGGPIYYLKIRGIEIDGKFYKWRFYNTFEDVQSSIEGYHKINNFDIDYYIGDKKRLQDLTPFPREGYRIHNNGGVPYIVCVGETVQVYQFPSDCGEESRNDTDYYTELVLEIVPEKIFIGIDKDNEEYLGNSILLKKSQNRYIYIGHKIYEFTTEDKILEYYSPVGNSDVPYPYAVGEKFMYLMIENVFIDKVDCDPYQYWYFQDYPKITPCDHKRKRTFRITKSERSALEIRDKRDLTCCTIHGLRHQRRSCDLRNARAKPINIVNNI